MIKVALSTHELLQASSVGAMRHLSSINKGRVDQHGAGAGGWGLHIEGACGELAYCKATGQFWSGTINSFKGADVGKRTQIRTRSHHGWDLIVRTDDDVDDEFVLVTGIAPTFVVRGWILGRDAKQHKWLKDHGGRELAYFVPQRSLIPIGVTP